MENETTNAIACCFDGCATEVIQVKAGRSTVLANHAICHNCRSVVLCEHHFSQLTIDGPLVCPACDTDDWRLVHAERKDPTPQEDLERAADRIYPIYAHSHPRGCQLIENGLLDAPNEYGGEVATLDGRCRVSYQGSIRSAALSSGQSAIALSVERQGAWTLEVSAGTGRPWQLVCESPGRVDSLTFLNERILLATLVRQDGTWELFSFELESANRLNGRRVCGLGGMPDGAPFHPIVSRVSAEQVVVTRLGAHGPVLEYVEISTGLPRVSIPLPFWPDLVRVSTAGHVLAARKGRQVGLAKDGRFVTLFEQYDLVDGIFDLTGALWLASSNSGLKINLETGSSEELYWTRAIIGLRAPFARGGQVA